LIGSLRDIQNTQYLCFYKIWGIPRLAVQLLDSQEPDLPVQSVAGRNLYKEILKACSDLRGDTAHLCYKEKLFSACRNALYCQNTVKQAVSIVTTALYKVQTADCLQEVLRDLSGS